jgi:amino acid transporter
MTKRKQTHERTMGLWSVTSIGVGAMIGAGLFALIGIAVDIAGTFAFLAFVIAGFLALLTAYSVSKMAVNIPSKGGPVKYLNTAFGSGIFAGTLNITMYMGYLIVASLYARAFGEYTIALLNIPEGSFLLNVFISFIVILFVVINFFGARAVGKSELIIVAIKVSILILFVALGFSTVKAEQLPKLVNFDLGKLLMASGVVFMSYEGFGLIVNTAEDVMDPKKTLPKALFISVIFVILIYLLVSLVVIGNLSVPDILSAKEYALAEAARPVMGALGFTVMGIAAMFSTASAINATIYGPVYMLQEAAKSKQIPSIFIHERFHHSSGNALIITGVIIFIIANTLNLESIAETGSLVFLMIYTFINIANLKMYRQTDSKRRIIIPGIIGTGFSFCMLYYFQILNKTLTVYLFPAIILASFLLTILNRWHLNKTKA